MPGCDNGIRPYTEQGNKVPASLYIVKAVSPLLSLDLIKALNVSIIGGKLNYIKEDDANAPPAIRQNPQCTMSILLHPITLDM